MLFDLNDKKTFKLIQEKLQNGIKDIESLFIENEHVVGNYRAMNDRVVFTNKRIITMTISGFDFNSFPYNKIQYFSIEAVGDAEVEDFDNALELLFTDGVNMEFIFVGSNNIQELSRMIGEFIL